MSYMGLVGPHNSGRIHGINQEFFGIDYQCISLIYHTCTSVYINVLSISHLHKGNPSRLYLSNWLSSLV